MVKRAIPHTLDLLTLKLSHPNMVQWINFSRGAGYNMPQDSQPLPVVFHNPCIYSGMVVLSTETNSYSRLCVRNNSFRHDIPFPVLFHYREHFIFQLSKGSKALHSRMKQRNALITSLLLIAPCNVGWDQISNNFQASSGDKTVPWREYMHKGSRHRCCVQWHGGVLLPASDNRPSFSRSPPGRGPGQRATLAAKCAQLCSALYSCTAQTGLALPLHLPIHVIKLSKDLYTKCAGYSGRCFAPGAGRKFETVEFLSTDSSS